MIVEIVAPDIPQTALKQNGRHGRPFYSFIPTHYGLGTLLMVFRICDTIWYGSPSEFGRRSSK